MREAGACPEPKPVGVGLRAHPCRRGEGFTSTSFDACLQERKLVGSRCRSCGALHVPPRPICPACHGEEMALAELSGQGTLAAFTVIHVAPTAMVEAGYGRENPYCVGIVQLAEGPRVSAQILGVDARRPEEIAIGMPLCITWRVRDSPVEPCPDEQEPPGQARAQRLAFHLSPPLPSLGEGVPTAGPE